MAPKVCLVTGCSAGGIGYGIAHELATQGARVYATARRPERMAGLGKAGCSCLKLDVTDDASVQAVVARIVDEEGRIDVLVNNAGAAQRGAILDTSVDGMRRLLDVNFFGCVRMAQAVGKAMVQQRSGTIVNIGSMSALWVLPFLGVYSATKAALSSLSDALRLELRPFGVNVTHVTLGFVKTKIFEKGSEAGQVTVDPSGPYARIERDIKRDIFDTVGFLPLTVDVVARRLAHVALSSHPPSHYYDGRWVWNTWLVSKASPAWASDLFSFFATGLWRLSSFGRATGASALHPAGVEGLYTAASSG